MPLTFSYILLRTILVVLPSYSLSWMRFYSLPRTLQRCSFSQDTINVGISQCFRRKRRFLSTMELCSSRNIEAVEQEIFELHGSVFNLKSPRQVSTAIFGKVQSTAKNELERVANGASDETEVQSLLASLVLEHRYLTKMSKGGTETEVTDSLRKLDALPPQEAKATQKPQEKRNVESSDPSKSSYASDRSPNVYDSQVDALFGGGSKLNRYWRKALHRVTRPSARTLVDQLDSSGCPMGYNPLAVPFDPSRGSLQSDSTATTTAGKKGSFLAFCRDQKEKYPDCVVLTRCGDFYETFGVDAIMLVEHCGLNAMGGKAKAGCPVRNVQATIDGLCQAGFKVAVYEEAADTTGKGRIKSRFLSQIVSSASPTYLYDLVLASHADTLVTAPSSRPFVGIISQLSGYTLVEVALDERSLRVCERMTSEAVACRLSAFPPADPLIYVPTSSEYKKYKISNTLSLPFLPSSRDAKVNREGGRIRTKLIPPVVVQQIDGKDETERAKQIILGEILTMNGEASGSQTATVDDFITVADLPRRSGVIQTQPLHVETATQLGLMNDPSIPELVSCLVPDWAPAATRNLLRRHLLSPPPPNVADAMRTLVGFLKHSNLSLPPLTIPPVGNVLALLRAGQASAQVYAEILRSLDAIKSLEETVIGNTCTDSLMTILEFESGMVASLPLLQSRCRDATRTIEEVISSLHHANNLDEPAIDRVSSFNEIVPQAFFERNEATWRGRVRPEAASEAYTEVEEAARRLADTVRTDFWLLESTENVIDAKSPVVQDIFNNIIAVKTVPQGATNKEMYVHPRDRFGKILKNRFTTEAVQAALSDYVSSCEAACECVTESLVQLSQRLFSDGHISAIVQASHSNLILSTAFHHAIQANAAGWGIAKVVDDEKGLQSASSFEDVWPYWMDRSEAVANTFNMEGMWLLTAPNMSGKSTIMRSTAAASLLSICGLCAPLSSDSTLNRFDHLFVRGASADVPSEKKSAFGAEMEDVAALLRSCGDQSLVFVDELGRGTSPRDGTRLAAAVLECMSVEGMSGIFATHLHDILQLPLRSGERIVRKRMAIHDRDGKGQELPNYKWTYRLEDGVSVDSLALVTAAKFGLPEHVIRRAEALGEHFPQNSVSESSAPASLPQQMGNDFTMVQVSQIIEETIGGSPILIPPKWSAPASLDGKSCTYIIQLQGSNRNQYYVGETDNVRQRIGQHRSKPGLWKDCSVLVVAANDKTQAMAWETLLIRELASVGVDLVSVNDGRSLRTNQDYRSS